jgi:hypothetical protein
MKKIDLEYKMSPSLITSYVLYFYQKKGSIGDEKKNWSGAGAVSPVGTRIKGLFWEDKSEEM